MSPKRTTKNPAKKDNGLTVWDPGEANPKQALFYASRTLYTAYGGAKGGGKTHAVRIKAFGGALANPGIRIIIFRQTYPSLEENHILPLKRMAAQTGAATYNGTARLLTFVNGSTIRFGHWEGKDSEDEYNGQEYDWVNYGPFNRKRLSKIPEKIWKPKRERMAIRGEGVSKVRQPQRIEGEKI